MKKVSMLLSYFEPFAGRPQNRSQEAVQVLRSLIERQLSSSFAPTQAVDSPTEMDWLEIIELPVVYAQAAQRLCSRIENQQPSVVISFGECEGNGLRWESVGYNEMNSLTADNQGVVMSAQVIDPAAPKYIEQAPWAEFLGRSSAQSAPDPKSIKRDVDSLAVSRDPGRFVCNDLIFRTSTWLRAQSFPLRYYFLHVGRETPQLAQTVEQIFAAIEWRQFLLDSRQISRSQ